MLCAAGIVIINCDTCGLPHGCLHACPKPLTQSLRPRRSHLLSVHLKPHQLRSYPELTCSKLGLRRQRPRKARLAKYIYIFATARAAICHLICLDLVTRRCTPLPRIVELSSGPVDDVAVSKALQLGEACLRPASSERTHSAIKPDLSPSGMPTSACAEGTRGRTGQQQDR
jgi:hypothetical protein